MGSIIIITLFLGLLGFGAMHYRTANPLARLIQKDFQLPVSEKTLSWVSFYLATPTPWEGSLVLRVLQHHQMSLDAEGLFAYRVEGKVWFRIAQATHPVTFDAQTIDQQYIDGLAFFMDANEVDAPRLAFGIMMGLMKELASELGASIVDQSRSPVTAEDILRIEDRLPTYEHQTETA